MKVLFWLLRASPVFYPSKVDPALERFPSPAGPLGGPVSWTVFAPSVSMSWVFYLSAFTFKLIGPGLYPPVVLFFPAPLLCGFEDVLFSPFPQGSFVVGVQPELSARPRSMVCTSSLSRPTWTWTRLILLFCFRDLPFRHVPRPRTRTPTYNPFRSSIRSSFTSGSDRTSGFESPSLSPYAVPFKAVTRFFAGRQKAGRPTELFGPSN